MNSFGTNFKVEIFGESHGESIGVTLDGVPSGLPLSVDDFKLDIDRRRPSARGTTSRKESDIPIFLSGVYNGHTNGNPLTIIFLNENTRSSDYSQLYHHFRPSHVDFVASKKYGEYADLRGGGAFSGRLTLALVAAGVVAKKILGSDVVFTTSILSIGGKPYGEHEELLNEVMRDGDSLGGLIECRVDGLPVGLGDPFFDSLESVISHIIFAVPAVKAVEFGSGVEASKMRGSQHNDMIISPDGRTLTNNSGGIVGGLSNGNEIVVRATIKPTASISKEQMTWDSNLSQVSPLRIKGRHDSCIALRAPVVIEAAVAIAIAQFDPI